MQPVPVDYGAATSLATSPVDYPTPGPVEQSRQLGNHTILELWDADAGVLNDEAMLREALQKAVRSAVALLYL